MGLNLSQWKKQSISSVCSTLWKERQIKKMGAGVWASINHPDSGLKLHPALTVCVREVVETDGQGMDLKEIMDAIFEAYKFKPTHDALSRVLWKFVDNGSFVKDEFGDYSINTKTKSVSDEDDEQFEDNVEHSGIDNDDDDDDDDYRPVKKKSKKRRKAKKKSKKKKKSKSKKHRRKKKRRKAKAHPVFDTSESDSGPDSGSIDFKDFMKYFKTRDEKMEKMEKKMESIGLKIDTQNNLLSSLQHEVTKWD